MWDQTSILRILASHEGAVALDEVCRQLDPTLPRAPGSQHRRNVIGTMGKLMASSHAKVAARDKLLQNKGVVSYSATAKGRALIAAGGTIKSGQPGPERGPRDPLENGMRPRIWSAFRMLKKGSVAELVELVHRKGDAEIGKVTGNARKYLTGLCRVGIAQELRTRAEGTAPSSNGFKRYALLEDVGPLAPVIGRHDVFDPNARKRIPYPKKEAK